MGNQADILIQLKMVTLFLSLRGFLNICEYFQITPHEFFNEDIEYPKILHDIMSGCSDLDKETLDSILVLINKINK